ncbi:hypothetical protein ACFP9V_19615 [Deinococcus radiopugnans]|uniref:hypothetical protein n=1 Tax=Deinococcus radiopugnans TaxID=57497 RepID=UPI003619CC3D
MSAAGLHRWNRAGANAIAHALRAWWCARLGRPLRDEGAACPFPGFRGQFSSFFVRFYHDRI